MSEKKQIYRKHFNTQASLQRMSLELKCPCTSTFHTGPVFFTDDNPGEPYAIETTVFTCHSIETIHFPHSLPSQLKAKTSLCCPLSSADRTQREVFVSVLNLSSTSFCVCVWGGGGGGVFFITQHASSILCNMHFFSHSYLFAECCFRSILHTIHLTTIHTITA